MSGERRAERLTDRWPIKRSAGVVGTSNRSNAHVETSRGTDSHCGGAAQKTFDRKGAILVVVLQHGSGLAG